MKMGFMKMGFMRVGLMSACSTAPAWWTGRFFNTELKTRSRSTQSSSPRAKRPCPYPPPEKRNVPQGDAAMLRVLRDLVFNSVLKKRPFTLAEGRAESHML